MYVQHTYSIHTANLHLQFERMQIVAVLMTLSFSILLFLFTNSHKEFLLSSNQPQEDMLMWHFFLVSDSFIEVLCSFCSCSALLGILKEKTVFVQHSIFYILSKLGDSINKQYIIQQILYPPITLYSTPIILSEKLLKCIVKFKSKSHGNRFCMDCVIQILQICLTITQ